MFLLLICGLIVFYFSCWLLFVLLFAIDCGLLAVVLFVIVLSLEVCFVVCLFVLGNIGVLLSLLFNLCWVIRFGDLLMFCCWLIFALPFDGCVGFDCCL